MASLVVWLCRFMLISSELKESSASCWPMKRVSGDEVPDNSRDLIDKFSIACGEGNCRGARLDSLRATGCMKMIKGNWRGNEKQKQAWHAVGNLKIKRGKPNMTRNLQVSFRGCI